MCVLLRQHQYRNDKLLIICHTYSIYIFISLHNNCHLMISGYVYSMYKYNIFYNAKIYFFYSLCTHNMSYFIPLNIHESKVVCVLYSATWRSIV